MSNRTLLDVVQSVMTKADMDSVNSISDTEESMQVASIARDVFLDMVVEYDLPSTKNLFYLEGLADVAKPSTMKLPDDVQKVLWVKYDCRLDAADAKSYRDMKFIEPYDFVSLCNNRDSTDTTENLVVVPVTNVSLVISKMNPPTYWTTFDDEYLYFDSYDSNVDNTMHSAKTICEGYKTQAFTLTDAHVPELPRTLMPLFEATVEAQTFAYLAQSINPKSEQRERRLRVREQRNKWRTKRPIYLGPDYGRK